MYVSVNSGDVPMKKILCLLLLLLLPSEVWAGTGTIAVTPGSGATFAVTTNGSSQDIAQTVTCDGTAAAQCAAVKAASTGAAAGDPSLVVGLSPNSSIPTGTNAIGSLQPATGASTQPGFAQQVPATLTITTSHSYVVGNCFGGFNSLSVVNTNQEAGSLQELRVTSIAGVVEGLTAYVFSSNPSSSTCTDASTFTLNSADIDKLITTRAFTLSAPTGATPTMAEVDFDRSLPFQPASSTKTVYVALVVNTAFTSAGSASDNHVSLGIAQR